MITVMNRFIDDPDFTYDNFHHRKSQYSNFKIQVRRACRLLSCVRFALGLSGVLSGDAQKQVVLFSRLRSSLIVRAPAVRQFALSSSPVLSLSPR